MLGKESSPADGTPSPTYTSCPPEAARSSAAWIDPATSLEPDGSRAFIHATACATISGVACVIPSSGYARQALSHDSRAKGSPSSSEASTLRASMAWPWSVSGVWLAL